MLSILVAVLAIYVLDFSINAGRFHITFSRCVSSTKFTKYKLHVEPWWLIVFLPLSNKLGARGVSKLSLSY